MELFSLLASFVIQKTQERSSSIRSFICKRGIYCAVLLVVKLSGPSSSLNTSTHQPVWLLVQDEERLHQRQEYKAQVINASLCTLSLSLSELMLNDQRDTRYSPYFFCRLKTERERYPSICASENTKKARATAGIVILYIKCKFCQMQ